MKKSLLTLGLCVISWQFSFGQTAFTATPSTQTVDLSSGNTFTVNFGLTVQGGGGDPANIQNFDLWLETAAANSGFFTISSGSPASPFDTSNSVTPTPDQINTTNSDNANAQNANDQGYSTSQANAVSTSGHQSTPIPLLTLNFTVDPSTPAGTYTFMTTGDSTESPTHFSDVSDTTPTQYFPAQASFSITVIPEPATWSLLALGGLGTLGFSLLRRRTF